MGTGIVSSILSLCSICLTGKAKSTNGACKVPVCSTRWRKLKKKKSLALWQIQPQHQNKGNLDLVWVTLYQKSTPLATICMYLIPDS